MTDISLWPRLAALPLVVEGYEIEGLTAELAGGMISAALDLALRQAGRALHEVLEREPRPLTFVNSLGLGDPASTDTVHRRIARYPDVHFKLDAAAAWTLTICEDLAATGAVDVAKTRPRGCLRARCRPQPAATGFRRGAG